MELIGAKFKSGYVQLSLDPDSKKVIITGMIKDTAVTGNVTLKPVKAAKEKN